MTYIRTLVSVICFCSYVNTYAQSSNDSTRLYHELKSYNRIETKHIGCFGALSDVFAKADSLKQIVSDQSFKNYFLDSSRVLKYYSFMMILPQNDSVAFEKLKSCIADTNYVDYTHAGTSGVMVRFNELLATEYLRILKAKYFYGGCSRHDGLVYCFGAKNTERWKLKQKKLKHLLINNQIDINKLEINI